MFIHSCWTRFFFSFIVENIFRKKSEMITEAVCLVGNKHLAGGGYLKLCTQHSFDDEVLHMSHQH